MRHPSLVLPLVLLAGCADERLVDSTIDPASGPAQLPLTIALEDGTELRGDALVVAALDGVDGFVQVRVDGRDDDGAVGWSAIGVAPVEALAGGTLTFELRKLPLAEGIANAARHRGDDSFIGADSGGLHLALGADGHVSGRAAATPSEVDATIEGPYRVECWVAPEALGQVPNGHGDATGAVRVLDEALESDFCRDLPTMR